MKVPADDVYYKHPGFELWFDQDKRFITGYATTDAEWDHSCFDSILRYVGIKIELLPFDEKIAKQILEGEF